MNNLRKSTYPLNRIDFDRFCRRLDKLPPLSEPNS